VGAAFVVLRLLRAPLRAGADLPSAISIIVRPVDTLVSASSTNVSVPPACASSILRSSQFSRFSLPRGFRRISSHSPFIRSPSRTKWRWPLSMSLADLPATGAQVPRSHSITVPPPYSPSGIVPSNVAYDKG
jgi:hypothetical protein